MMVLVWFLLPEMDTYYRWSVFFSLQVAVPDDLLQTQRMDLLPQIKLTDVKSGELRPTQVANCDDDLIRGRCSNFTCYSMFVGEYNLYNMICLHICIHIHIACLVFHRRIDVWATCQSPWQGNSHKSSLASGRRAPSESGTQGLQNLGGTWPSK